PSPCGGCKPKGDTHRSSPVLRTWPGSTRRPFRCISSDIRQPLMRKSMNRTTDWRSNQQASKFTLWIF
ncbi:UNVERIFIED_CONTAM: hypothetical protein GTU68_007822, partial [Idotea baltica]|nr:hypothetical protein [Idotea baltica]